MELVKGKYIRDESYIINHKGIKKKKPRNKKNKSNNKKKKPLIVRIFINIIKIILILIIWALAASIPVIKYLGNVYCSLDDEFNALLVQMAITNSQSYILDLDGKIIAELNGDEKRKEVALNEMSPYLPLAYVAIEDERFFNHHGVDLKRTSAAIYTYIKKEYIYKEDASISFGGSSITQQLVKNITNNRERTIERKIKEWMLAFKLDHELGKNKILEEYLNILFVGSDIYGVELGSQYYFSKSSSDLSIAECAFLAGITNQPNYYNPFDKEKDNTEDIKLRTKTVLRKMLDTNFITEKQYNNAIEEVEKGLAFKKSNISNKVYSYHTDETINAVIKDIAKQNEWTTDYATNYVYSSGLTIYSTQNTNIQNIIMEELKKPEYIIKSKLKENETAEAAIVIIDHKTGYVLGCGGRIRSKNNISRIK